MGGHARAQEERREEEDQAHALRGYESEDERVMTGAEANGSRLTSGTI